MKQTSRQESRSDGQMNFIGDPAAATLPAMGRAVTLKSCVRLLTCYCEESLKSGWCFLAVGNRSFNFPEPRVFKQACDFYFREPQMGISVKFASLLKRMLQEVENHYFAFGFEDPVDLFESTGWI